MGPNNRLNTRDIWLRAYTGSRLRITGNAFRAREIFTVIREQSQWRKPKFYTLHPIKVQQEAQLSQRGRAMLRVIEYFAKSLKVIPNDIVE